MPVREVVPILAVLLEDGGTALVLELLNRVNEDRRVAICKALARTAPWIAQFPRARDEIIACRRTMAGPSKIADAKIARSPMSQLGAAGFVMACAGGVILWTEQFGAHVVSGSLLEYHHAAGGSGGRLGFPAGAARTVASIGGTTQEFEGCPATGPVTACASGRGAFVIPAPVLAHLADYSDPYEILGAPVGEAWQTGRSRWGTTGVAQHFERGLVVAARDRPALLVTGGILGLLERTGAIQGELGFPLTGPLRTVTGPPGEAARGHWYQIFEGHRPLPVTEEESFRDFGLPPGGALAVDPDDADAAIHVAGPIWEACCADGGFDGRLGFPVAAAIVRPGRAAQVFQGGTVMWSEAHGAFTVPGPVWDHIGGDGGLDDVGWPVGEQTPSPGDPSAFQQEFEHAIVMVRDGVVKIWRE